VLRWHSNFRNNFREIDGLIGDVNQPDSILEIKFSVNSHNATKVGKKQVRKTIDIARTRFDNLKGILVVFDTCEIFKEEASPSKELISLIDLQNIILSGDYEDVSVF